MLKYGIYEASPGAHRASPSWNLMLYSQEHPIFDLKVVAAGA